MNRPLPELTPTLVERWALTYLDRYAATEAHLTRVLRRRATRGRAPDTYDRELVEGWIEATVARAVGARLVDDQRLATDVAASMHRKGGSRRALQEKLRNKGVPRDISETITRERTDDDELTAAANLARRRSIGPWRRAEVDRDGRRKELEKLARAGFSYDVARRVIDAESPAEPLTRVCVSWHGRD